MANDEDQQTVELPDSSSFVKSGDFAITDSIVKDAVHLNNDIVVFASGSGITVADIVIEDANKDQSKTEKLNDDIAMVASGSGITVADIVIEDTNNEQKKTEKNYHVRVDNFQRPLTDKLLFEWLAKTLGHEVLKENLWMNKIKTHCYIDFESISLAQACISAVTGSKVDSKHTMQLVADMTDVSAQEAETSPEAKMKPNEWKNNKASPVGLISLPQNTKASIAATSGSSIDIMNNNVIMKAVNHQLSASDSTKISESRNPNAGLSIRGNEQIGFSTRRNRIDDGTGITKTTEDVSLKRQRVGSTGSEDVFLRGRNVNDKNKDEDVLELDKFFRKTKAKPPLYWLPVTEDIIKFRKEHLITNK